MVKMKSLKCWSCPAVQHVSCDVALFMTACICRLQKKCDWINTGNKLLAGNIIQNDESKPID